MEEVIRRARAGDREALAHLWRSYQHLLLRYFRGKGMNEPEDLASTVWIEVASGLVRFEGDESDFRRWLFTIAARRRIDDIRATKRRADRIERAPIDERPAHARSAGDEAERAAGLDAAIAMVQSLPPDQAEAVLLRVVADLGVTEVAEIMHRSEGAVRVLVHRGLKRLADRLAVTNPDAETMSAL
ncbi:MAG TPA: sigma-70 family RNA polymerase sigma factor [Ilumatobacter sp.]|nr:sigma-70 family RNA polymerase sigma factor [Ilumatobacter sp.]